MLNWVWIIMIAGSLIYALFTNNLADATAGLIAGAESTVTLCLSLAAAYALWMGLLKVLEKADYLAALIRLLKKPLSALFPRAFKDKAAAEAISVNIAANMLGLGNAATPSGMKAAQLMKKDDKITDEIAMLLVINASSIQLIPTTVITLRTQFGSANPADIVLPVLLSTIVSTATGIILCRICAKRRRKKKNAADY